jgi:hypothetical protein
MGSFRIGTFLEPLVAANQKNLQFVTKCSYNIAILLCSNLIRKVIFSIRFSQ